MAIEPLLKLGAGFVIAVGLVSIPACSYISANNYAVRTENNIKTEENNNQLVLTRMSNTVMDNAKVPEMMKDDLLEVVKAGIEGRYANDKNLLAKSVTEAYPGTISPDLYTRLMNSVEAGRLDFEQAQRTLIEKVNLYRQETEVIGWRSFWISMTNHPQINFDDYKPIISDYTNDAFTTKRDNGLPLGKK